MTVRSSVTLVLRSVPYQQWNHWLLHQSTLNTSHMHIHHVKYNLKDTNSYLIHVLMIDNCNVRVFCSSRAVLHLRKNVKYNYNLTVNKWVHARLSPWVSINSLFQSVIINIYIRLYKNSHTITRQALSLLSHVQK